MDHMDFASNSREVALRCTDGMKSATMGLCEIARDFILPDSFADIKRILSTSVSLAPSANYIEGAKAHFSGELLCHVLFLTDEGDVHALPCTLDYEGAVSLGSADCEYNATFMPCVESVSVRSVNPRKIGIKAKIDPNLYAWEKRDASVAFPDNLTGADLESFEEKNESLSYMTVLHASASGVESGDDIRIEEPRAPIGEMLFCDITFSGVSAEAREDKIAINATACVNLCYNEDAEGKPIAVCRHDIALSTLLDCEGAREGDAVTAALYCEKVSCVPSDNAAGEARIAELDFTYGVQADLCRKESVTVVKDLYSTRYECENTESEIRVSSLVGKSELSLRAVGEVAVSEEGEVIAVSALSRGLQLLCDEQQNGYVEGAMLATVLLRGGDGALRSESVEVPIHAETDFVFKDKPEYLLSLVQETPKATWKGGNLSVEIPLTLTLTAWESEKARVIAASRVIGKCEKKPDSGFIVYFPAAGEGLWEIAKKYRVKRSCLILSEGDAASGARRALIVPQRKKAIFSSVIT